MFYRSACHEEADMTAVAEAAETSLRAADTRFTRLVREGKCVYLRGRLSAVLLERMSGPYETPQGPAAHVWRVLDGLGDQKFIFLDRTSGPHPPLR